MATSGPSLRRAWTASCCDYHRTMAVGTARVYVHAPGPFREPAYLEALRHGRSFVTSGPFLDFRVGGERPGGVVAGGGSAPWRLAVAATGPVEVIDLLVNGEVVATRPGLEAGGTRSLEGTLDLPSGGWVAVRAHGGVESWPGMNGAVFAQTSPVWIGSVGSREPAAAARAANDLLAALDVAEARVAERYGDLPIPRIRARFTAARARIAELGGVSGPGAGSR